MFMSADDAITHGIAIYAAIVSTLGIVSGLSWEIFKWRQSRRPSVRVGAIYNTFDSKIPPGFEITIVNDSDFPVWLQNYYVILSNKRKLPPRIVMLDDYGEDRPIIEPHNSLPIPHTYDARSGVFGSERAYEGIEGCKLAVVLSDGTTFYSKRFSKFEHGQSNAPL